jgi:hypothetical protein
MEQNSPSTQPEPAKLQAYVDYLPGITIAGAESALIEWSADDRIKLFKMDFNVEPAVATEVLFDVPVSEVKNVGGSMIMLVFEIGDTAYNVQFSRTAMAKLAVGGGVGVALAQNDTSAVGLHAWVTTLKQHNVPMKGYKGWAWSMNVALIVVGILLVVSVIGVLIPTINGLMSN